jgi:hypothetical protein
MSKLGSTRAQVPAGVFVHELHAPSILGRRRRPLTQHLSQLARRS